MQNLLKVKKDDILKALEISAKLEANYSKVLYRLLETNYTFRTWYTLWLGTKTLSQWHYINRNRHLWGYQYREAFNKNFITKEELDSIEFYFSTWAKKDIQTLLKAKEVYLDPYDFERLYKLLEKR